MRDSFILYTEYAKHIELLSMEQRGVLFTAIMAYQTGVELPQMDGMTGMAFSFISAQLERDNVRYDETCKKRSEGGKQGGRPRKADTSEEDTEEEKAKGFSEEAKKAKGFFENQTKAKKPDNEYEYEYEYDSFPPLSPQTGERGEDFKGKFFSLYPKLKTTKRLKDGHIDYSVLIDRFARSKHLQELYSMKVVLDKYEAIVAGEFDDEKIKDRPGYRTEAAIAADERRERERYYAILCQRAEAKADAMRKKAMADEEFSSAESACRKGEIELAKAELYSPEKVAEIEARLRRAQDARNAALLRLGIAEADLTAQANCPKCSDTGFLPDGRMCDCYKENKR